MTFRILTVCTGNICRSPLAAQLLQAKLSMDTFEVHSAGISALEGAPMPEPAQKIAARLDLSSHQHHRGMQLYAEDVASADVVFALAREHRRGAVELHPPAVRYAYTLTEFAHIASNTPDDDLAEMVQTADTAERGALDAVSQLRGVVPPLESSEGLDIVDPYRRSVEVYERSSSDIAAAVNSIVDYFNRAVDLR